MGKVKICHLIGGLEVGGTERFLSRLVVSSNSDKFEFIVISLGDIGVIGDELINKGFTVESIGMKKNIFDIFRIFNLIRLLRIHNPDVIQSWLYLADIIGGVVGKIIRTPVVWGVRQSNIDTDSNDKLTLLLIKISSLLSRWLPDKIVYCAESARTNHHNAGYIGDSVVIPNGINSDAFINNDALRKNARKQWGVSDDQLLIGMVARFHQQKGHADFINMASILSKKNNAVKFVLIGESVDLTNRQLMTLVNHYQMKELILFPGYMEDIPMAMNGLDIYVSSSTGEGWPNAIAEAMSCGVLCAVTDVGDSGKILGNTGRLVNASNPKDMAVAVASLLDLDQSKKNEYRDRARRRIVNNFQIDKSVKAYQKLYLNLV
jgi:glycosyltransferase involved in cell wall biosynthesis